jgi:phosphoribosylanthranilate isomerase
VRLLVKVCGVTTPGDGVLAAEAGADAVGLNFYPGSKRVVSVAQARRIAAALPPFVWKVGVFVNAPLAEVRRVAKAVGLDAVQLHGDEAPAFVEALGLTTVKALHVGARPVAALARAYAGADVLLLDAAQAGFGGGGVAFDWALAIGLARRRPVLLAGGLHPGNVAEAVRAVRPFGVDVASGVEKRPGVKDRARLAAFVHAARAAATPPLTELPSP